MTISCTGLPLYETGGNGSDELAGRVVHQLLHGGAAASHVIAPVIPVDGRGCVDMSEEFVAELEKGRLPA